MPSIAILLCTFNGTKFLLAQLQSFEIQEFQNWHLFVSDDGSIDDTLSLLSKYQCRIGSSRVQIRSGPQKGFVANFLGLACDPSIRADYFAYSDQDDVWEPDKLSRAVAWLDTVPPHVPAMYCTRTRLIDDAGNDCGYSPLFRRPPSFRNALVQSIAGGNTMVFNQATRDLLMLLGSTVQVPSHDWWTYLVTTAAGGKVRYDPVPSVRYRMHGENQVGSNIGWTNRIRRLVMLARGRFAYWTDLNLTALDPFRLHMSAESRALFDLFRDSRERGPIARQLGLLRTGAYRQTLVGNIGLIFAVWTKKI